ncbi:MAG: MarR family transcriptional regulator [Firmicutes bacterium]|nr:MarR family transcriptional regulator [Bacillota bacterium]
MKLDSIGRYISSIYRHQSILINKYFEKYGFGSGQYIFLINISKNEGINQKQLSENVKIDRANTNRAIKKLEKLGYIYTVEDKEDRRSRKSFLTEKGKEIIPLVIKDLANITEIMAQGMDDNQREKLLGLLQLIEKNIMLEVDNIRKDKCK